MCTQNPKLPTISPPAHVNPHEEGLIQSIPIRIFDLDLNHRLSPPQLCNYLQEAATYQADFLDLGLDSMLERGFGWVLFRMRLEFYGWVNGRDWLYVQTYPSGRDTFQAFRQFRWYNQEQKVLGVGSSSWLTIDINKKRPVPMEKVLEPLRPIQLGEELLPPPDKLEFTLINPTQYQHTVHYSEIDVYQHTNNVNYVKWALNGLPRDIIQHFYLSSLEINFNKETTWGDDIIIVTAPDNVSTHTYYHKITRVEDNQTVCLLRSTWKQ
jgi:medium-chain acyl-[acyl-carrier-protein] hydrolase